MVLGPDWAQMGRSHSGVSQSGGSWSWGHLRAFYSCLLLDRGRLEKLQQLRFLVSEYLRGGQGSKGARGMGTKQLLNRLYNLMSQVLKHHFCFPEVNFSGSPVFKGEGLTGFPDVLNPPELCTREPGCTNKSVKREPPDWGATPHFQGPWNPWRF